MILTLANMKGSQVAPDLWCDKTFNFEEVRNKCLRQLVGNCLYNEIISACEDWENAPDYIVNLLNGHEYATTNNSCCCSSCSDCETSYFQGLNSLLKLCIEYHYIKRFDFVEVYQIEKKIDKVYYKKDLDSLIYDTHNQLASRNNLNDCGTCVSLWKYACDFKDVLSEFKGIKFNLISLI